VPAELVPGGLAEQSARYRSLTAGRALLIVLDNAFSAAQVRQLLPGAGPSFVLVTSRQRLAGLVADGGVEVDVRPLAEADSVALLEGVLGAARIGRERGDATALARICGGLPIALAVVAARLAARPKLPLARLAVELEGETDRLRRMRTAEGVSVLGSLDLSYQGLGRSARAVYRRLSVMPGREYGPGPIAALAGSAGRAEAAVELLLGANLLEEVESDRFRQHDLLFLHARKRFESDEPAVGQSEARRACLEWFLAVATAADRVLTPYRGRPFAFVFDREIGAEFAGREQALEWLDDERAALIAAGRMALEHGWAEMAWHLADVLWPLLLYKKHYRDRIGIDEVGVAAAQQWGNRWAEADMRKRLGDAFAEAGRAAEAEEQLRLSVGLFAQAGDHLGELAAQEQIASLFRDNGREREAINRYAEILDANRAIGEPRRVGLTLIRLGALRAKTGDPARAIEHLLEARAVFGELVAVDPYNQQRVEIALAGAYLAGGDLAEADAAAAAGAAGMRRLGSLFEEAQAVEVRARVAYALGDPARGRRHRDRALAIYDELGSPRARALRDDPALVEDDSGAPDRGGRVQ
jgi:tetratricopeptide (TPR) repeat protein